MASQATGDGQLAHHRHLRARHRPRYRAGAGAEPRRGRRVAPAGGGAPDRRDGAQVLARHADGDPSLLAGRLARPALHLQLRDPAGRATCWRGSTASATCASSAPATTRCGSGSTRRRSPSRNMTAGEVVAALRSQNVQVASGVLNQPPVPRAGRLPAQRRDARPPRPIRGSSATSSSRPTPTAASPGVEDVARVELAAQDYTRQRLSRRADRPCRC